MTAAAEERPALLRRVGATFVAGFLAAFPLWLTLIVVVWLADFTQRMLGPGSVVGGFMRAIGLTVVTSEVAAYLIGLGIALVLIYVLGLLVEAGLRHRWNALIESVVNRVPLVSTIYDAAKKLTQVFEPRGDSELREMRPVVCHLGGPGGAALLGLMPSSDRIHMNGHDYCAVLIPSAPVPIGGAIVYLPASWVEPADFNVEGLINIYVSMGVTSSEYLHSPPDTGPGPADDPGPAEGR